MKDLKAEITKIIDNHSEYAELKSDPVPDLAALFNSNLKEQRELLEKEVLNLKWLIRPMDLDGLHEDAWKLDKTYKSSISKLLESLATNTLEVKV